MMDRTTRRIGDPRQAAEAAFKKATTKPPDVAAPRVAALPAAREAVSLRIDREVLEKFQEGGAGWQERINAALRRSIGL